MTTNSIPERRSRLKKTRKKKELEEEEEIRRSITSLKGRSCSGGERWVLSKGRRNMTDE